MMNILSVFSARVLLSFIPFIPSALVSAGNAPLETEMLLILPGQKFAATEGFTVLSMIRVSHGMNHPMCRSMGNGAMLWSLRMLAS